MKILFAILLLFCSCQSHVDVNAKMPTIEKPNIIIILADDIGYEIPTYTGGQSYSTPNIDSMALHGIQFTHCEATPLCSPSRFQLLTGRYNNRNYNKWGSLDTNNRTIANMLHDAGYKTCVAGKWQFDGGMPSIHALGFDSGCVWQPFNDDDLNEGGGGHKYKQPHVYVNGAYLPNNQIATKYGEDIFRQYLFDFIDSNKTQPFFCYWALNLCHKPFQPTPDDTSFSSWVNRPPLAGDTIYVPSMVKYMDKEIGLLLYKLDSMNLSENTLVIFIGDNGTDPAINSLWNGQWVKGGKGLTTEAGTHVPMIVYGLGSGIDTSLVDFTDFMPTIANIAGVTSLPTDGFSFYPNKSLRQWIYCHFRPQPDNPDSNYRRYTWAQDYNYKKYDSTATIVKIRNAFFDLHADPLELHKITSETYQQKIIDSTLKSVIQSMQ